MNRTQTACFFLLASAFVLSAILVVRIDQKAQPNAAMANGQNIAQPAFQLMTARTRGDADNGDESLFVLDSGSGKLVVYVPNVGNKRLDVVTAMEVKELFR